MAGVSMLGGILAYTRRGSVPSLVACSLISGGMTVSSMRIRDGLAGGYEGAVCELLAGGLSAKLVLTRSDLCGSACADVEVG